MEAIHTGRAIKEPLDFMIRRIANHTLPQTDRGSTFHKRVKCTDEAREDHRPHSTHTRVTSGHIMTHQERCWNNKHLYTDIRDNEKLAYKAQYVTYDLFYFGILRPIYSHLYSECGLKDEQDLPKSWTNFSATINKSSFYHKLHQRYCNTFREFPNTYRPPIKFTNQTMPILDDGDELSNWQSYTDFFPPHVVLRFVNNMLRDIFFGNDEWIAKLKNGLKADFEWTPEVQTTLSRKVEDCTTSVYSLILSAPYTFNQDSSD
jgi:hypothetical protein